MPFDYHFLNDTLKTDCSYLGFSQYGLTTQKAGIIDGNGNELLKPGLYTEVLMPQNGMVRYYLKKGRKTLCGYYSLDSKKDLLVNEIGKPLDEIKYWTHGDFIGGIAPVNKDTWTFIDKNGNTLRSGYEELKHDVNTGLWAVKNKTGKWDVFDENNNDIAKLSGYEAISFPKNKTDKEVFSVKKDGKYGCITRGGNVIIPFKHDYLYNNIYDVLLVKNNNKWGALTLNNTVLVPVEYANIKIQEAYDTKHFWVERSDSLYYHFNTTTKRLSTTGYMEVRNFKDNIAMVVPKDLVIEDNSITRAQLLDSKLIEKADDDLTKVIKGKTVLEQAKASGLFGYLINTDDKTVIYKPVPLMYKDNITEEIKKSGKKSLTLSEQKNIYLKATQNERSYKLDSVIGEEEWNY